jgi:uncharacterized membrane protein HdeD (DUF308 family)
LLSALAEHWWALVLRGLGAIALGAVAWARPDLFWAWLVLLFAVYAIVDGAFAIVAAFRGEGGDRWLHLLEGGLGIGFGIFALVSPGVAGTVIVLVIGIWAVATGLLEIVSAIRLRREIEDEILLALGGGVSAVLGAVLIARPHFGEVATTYVLGTYGIVFGVLLVLLGFRLRPFRKNLSPGS